MAPVRRLAFVLVTPLVATLIHATPVAAQSTYTWNNNGASDWLNSGNWSGSPTSFPGTTNNAAGNNAGDTAVFASTLPLNNAAGIDMSAGAAAGLLQLGLISFSNTLSDLAIGNSSTSQTG